MPDPVWLTSGPIASSRGYLNECGTCGALVPNPNVTQHINFHRTFSNRKGDDMSNVLWCDPGDHAFKKGAPGSMHFDGSSIGEDGSTIDQSMDMCADHNPLRARPENIVKELQSEFPINGGVVD